VRGIASRLDQSFYLQQNNWCYINAFAARPIFRWVPSPGRTFAEVPAGYLLWCWCTAELHVLNDEYTRQWHLTMHINLRHNSAVAANVLIIVLDIMHFCLVIYINNTVYGHSVQLYRFNVKWLESGDPEIWFKFDNVAVLARLRAAIHNIDASRWQKCLHSWTMLQRAAAGRLCTVSCGRSGDTSQQISYDTPATDRMMGPVELNQSWNSSEDSEKKAAVKRPSADLITFRVSGKCAGKTLPFNSQVSITSYLYLRFVIVRIISVAEWQQI